MPDESDGSETGDPADGSEEPPESPDDADPERGSPIDPSELDTRADASETTASDGAETEAEDAPEAESDADADADDSPADGGRDGPDPERTDDEDDATKDTSDDDTSDVAGDDGDGDDPTADGDPDEAETGNTADAVDFDVADDDGGDEVDADGATDEDADTAGTDVADGEARDEETEDDEDGADSAGTDEDDSGVDGLDDWPSVGPDPVDVGSEADDGLESDTDDIGEDDSGIDGLDDWPSVGPEPVDIDSGEGDVADDTDGVADEVAADDGEGASGEAEPDDEGDMEHGGDDTGDEEGIEDAALPEAQTDGEGYVGNQPGGGGSAHDDGLGGVSTPPDDQEMPLADHIEEMILRLAVVFLFGAAGTAIGLLGASPAIDYIWQNVLPVTLDAPPHVYHPLELWLTRIKVAALLGILVGLPMFVYQCYLFMRPGLYENERKYYLSAVPMSLVLAVVGMAISFVLVLPVLFQYFTYYSEGSAGIAYALGETFNLIITLTGFLAIVFQIPLFIMLAIMMGVTTRRWLADKRLYFWAGFFGLSFVFTIDPTLMAPIIVAIIMIVLFEGTLLLLRWTGQE